MGFKLLAKEARYREAQGHARANVPSIGIDRETHFCGVNSGRDVDKFRETGLTPMPSKKVKPPRIEECFGHIECKVVGAHVCGDHTLFVREVLSASANEEVIKGGTVDVLRARPMVQKNHVYFTPTDER